MIKVLVLDDDVDLLEMVTVALRAYGMHVNFISKSSLLHGEISASRPDIILMDIFLDDEDGRKLCKDIKTSENLKNIPVILYSAGQISTSSIQESLADDFFAKPFDLSLLTSRMHTLVG